MWFATLFLLVVTANAMRVVIERVRTANATLEQEKAFTNALSKEFLFDYPEIYATPYETVLGCQCKTNACSESSWYQCSAAPLCQVKSATCVDGEAAWSITLGYYDYCVFKQHTPYERLEAEKKQSILLKRVRDDSAPGSYPFFIKVIPNIVGESVMVTFDSQSDVFTLPRSKPIHSVGVVGGISFVSEGDHPYTGIFKGADYGIIRLSSAKQPLLPGFPVIKPSFAPGAAFKFLRDGQPSANFMAMPSLDGQSCNLIDSNDFFKYDFNNHVPNTGDFALKMIAAKFWQGSSCPLMLGLSDLARQADGQNTFPWQLSLEPVVHVECSCMDYKGACLDALSEIEVGSVLFNVNAIDKPHGTPQRIGHIKLTSELTTSKFGDEALFFKHQRMEEDFEIHPEWLQAIDKRAECGMQIAGVEPPTIEGGCDSPFSFGNVTGIDLGMRGDDS